MKFRRSAPALLIGAVVVVVISLSLLSSWLFSGFTSAVEKDQLLLMRSIVEFNLKGAEGKALARAEMLADLPEVKKLLAAKDREGLLAETKEMFRVQKEKHGVDQAQFHAPDLTSFLRLHDPEKFGDDLSKFRPIVVAVNRDKTAKKGFAIARSGPAIFGVTPVTDEGGNFIGSFEFGISFGGLLDGLKAAYGLELAIFVEEEPLKEFAKGVGGDIINEQNRVGKFIRFHSTNADLLKELVSEKDLGALDATDYSREALGTPYGVVLVPLRNGAGDVLGMIAVAKDFSSSRSAEGRTVVWQALMALFAVVFLAGVILILIRGVILQPIQQISNGFASLVSGEKAQEIPDAEFLCEELQSLVQQYDKLRSAGNKEEEQ